jgi:hypothetical protein
VEIKDVGSVIFAAESGEHRLLTKVYYIPALRNSIINLGQLDESGSRVEIKDGVMRIWNRHHRLLVKVTRCTNQLYVLNVQVAQPLCLTARRDNETWQWHERFRHLHFEALKRLSAKGMVRGLSSLDYVEQFCDVCVLTKQRRLLFPQQSSFRAKERLELVHGDLCDPVTPATLRGRRYFLLLADDLSRYMWVVILGSKGEAANAIRRAHAAAEECGRKLRVLRTDNGSEFTVAEFASYCVDESVQRRTPPLLHVVQPAAERRRRAAQLDGCGDGSGPPQAEGNACCLLGRGGGDGCLHPQPLAHQGTQRQDAVRGLAWAQAGGLSPTGLRLPRVR